MSTAAPEKPKTGGSEIAKRAGDLLPVMHAAAAAVGLETLRRVQHDAADRTAAFDRFQHDLMRKETGLEPLPQPAGESSASESAMGDMIVVGEINTGGSRQGLDEALQMLKGKVLDQKTEAAPVASPAAAPASSTLGKLALGAALLSAGGGLGTIGGALAASMLNQQPAVVQQGDADTDTTATIGIKRD